MRILICLILSLCLISKSLASEPQVYASKHLIHSDSLNANREYYVHLPPSYNKNEDVKYPVLYLLHGQWDMLGAVASIDTISNSLPELIIVGVQGKGKELRPQALADDLVNNAGLNFNKYLLKELIPHIENNYRTADFRILSGHSNAGRFVMNTLLNTPTIFNAYFAFSPSLEDNLINEKVKNRLKILIENGVWLMLTLASEGKQMSKPFGELINMFALHSGKEELFYHKTFSEQSHMGSRIPSLMFSLQSLFKNWTPSWELKMQGLPAVQNFYDALTKQYGFNVKIPSIHLLQMIYVFSSKASNKDDKMVEDIVAYYLRNVSSSELELLDVVEQLKNNGEKGEGLNLLKVICMKKKQANECQ